MIDTVVLVATADVATTFNMGAEQSTKQWEEGGQ